MQPEYLQLFKVDGAGFRVEEQVPCRNVQRFRGGLVIKAHGLLYHSTLGLRLIKKKTKKVQGSGLTDEGLASMSAV